MKTKQQIRQFIEINHHLMTVKEMAEELGIPSYRVDLMCRYYGWRPVYENERKEQVKVITTSQITSDMIPGLWEVAAQMMEGATEEEKKRFYELYMK